MTEESKQVERQFNTYISSMQSHKIVTETGKCLHVIGGKLLTDNESDIAFLDDQIAKGFPFLRKGDVVTTSDLDPMASLRKKIIAEYLASQPVVPAERDMGSTDLQKVTPLSSEGVASLLEKAKAAQQK
jgi:hypothetical protein